MKLSWQFDLRNVYRNAICLRLFFLLIMMYTLFHKESCKRIKSYLRNCLAFPSLKLPARIEISPWNCSQRNLHVQISKFYSACTLGRMFLKLLQSILFSKHILWYLVFIYRFLIMLAPSSSRCSLELQHSSQMAFQRYHCHYFLFFLILPLLLEPVK